MLVLIGNVIYAINDKKKKSSWSPIVANLVSPGRSAGSIAPEA